MKISIAIVEDDEKTRKWLLQRFHFFEEINILFTAKTGEDLLKQLSEMAESDYPQIILMDIELPGMSGIDATAMVKEYYPGIEVIMQTVFEDEQKIFKSIQAGASGYLLKDVHIDEYISAIKELIDGGAPLSSCVARKVLDFVREPEHRKRNKLQGESFSLTAREMEILHFIVEDLTEHHIADELYISPHTVRTHIKNIYKKLHVHSRASAVRIALENNLIF